MSTLTIRLKLNYDPNKALAEISSKVDQVRNDLPPEAEIPALTIATADSQFASCYLSFTSGIRTTNAAGEVEIKPRGGALQSVKIEDAVASGLKLLENAA